MLHSLCRDRSRDVRRANDRIYSNWLVKYLAKHTSQSHRKIRRRTGTSVERAPIVRETHAWKHTRESDVRNGICTSIADRLMESDQVGSR